MRFGIAFFLVASFPAWGAPQSETVGKPQKPVAEAAATQREHSFDEILVQGKYHFSDEAVTTVEEDKVLDALIGVRTDFKDRIDQSASRK